MEKGLVVATVARWILTLLGGWLASKGVASADEVEMVIGAVAGLAAIAWSIYEKRQASKVHVAEVTVAAVTGVVPTPPPPK